MSKTKKRLGIVSFLVFAVLITAGVYLSHVNIPVLQPRGPIADKEFKLLVLIVSSMLIVAVPVFLLLAYVVWRYREDNPKRGKYEPDWEHSRWLEGLWWAIPAILITIVSVITWNASYALNPYLPLKSSNKAITIQVVSLNWKWLFIYPNQKIATINYFELPVNTPIHFYLTSDAPMNSFWLPQLSGQIFTMAGMQTQLYLAADSMGTYYGSSANISGVGFANMHFNAISVSSTSFKAWALSVKDKSPNLSMNEYMMLRQPSSIVKNVNYSYPVTCLFNTIINSYMMPVANGMGKVGV